MQTIFPTQYNNGYNMSPSIQNGGVGYAPTPPTFRYNGYIPQQNFNYYSNLGQYAMQQMNAQPYTYNTYVGYNQPQYFDYNQQKDRVFEDAYRNGSMPLSQYLSYSSSPFKYVDNNGRYTAVNNNSDDWFIGIVNQKKAQQENERRYLENLNQQMTVWNMLCTVNNRFFGIPDRDETGQTMFERKVLYDQAMQAYLYQVQQIDQEQEKFENFTKTLVRSTDKKYVSPLKNAYYHIRNDKYPESYGIDEYLNKGILTNQIFDNMILDAKVREVELFYQYNQNDFRQSMHMMHPNYDPLSGASSARLSLDDMEVTLPPQISQNEYFERKNKFINAIMNNNRYSMGGAV